MPPQTDAKKENKPPFNPNQSPKQRFLAQARWIGEHRTMVDSDAFQRAVDHALLQLQHELTPTIKDGNGAGSVGLQLQGAQYFLSILKNLSETAQLQARRPDDNLTHK